MQEAIECFLKISQSKSDLFLKIWVYFRNRRLWKLFQKLPGLLKNSNFVRNRVYSKIYKVKM